MNDEIANFFIKFTAQGIDDVKKALDETNKKLDDITDSFKKTQDNGEAFFSALKRWTGLVGGLTAAFVILKNTINGVFDTAESVVDLYGKEQTLGVEAKVLEQYGLISRRNGGSQAEAYAFWEDVDRAMTKYQEGKPLGDDELTRNSYIGFNYSYNPNLDPAANRAAYIDAMRKSVQQYYNNTDQNIQTHLKDLVKQESFLRAFAADDEGWQKMLAWGDKWRVWSKDEKTLKDAQKMETVKIEWEQLKEELHVKLIPIVTRVLEMLEPKMKQFYDWLDQHGEEYVENIEKWLTENGPTIIKALENVGDAIMSLIRWLAGDKQPMVEVQTDVGTVAIPKNEYTDRVEYENLKTKFPDIVNTMFNPDYRAKMEKIPIDIAMKMYMNDVETAMDSRGSWQTDTIFGQIAASSPGYVVGVKGV